LPDKRNIWKGAICPNLSSYGRPPPFKMLSQLPIHHNCPAALPWITHDISLIISNFSGRQKLITSFFYSHKVMYSAKRALISVSDKTGVVDFAAA